MPSHARWRPPVMVNTLTSRGASPTPHGAVEESHPTLAQQVSKLWLQRPGNLLPVAPGVRGLVLWLQRPASQLLR